MYFFLSLIQLNNNNSEIEQTQTLIYEKFVVDYFIVHRKNTKT